MCFVWIWEQTAIISLQSTGRLVFVNETVCLLRGTDWVFKCNLGYLRLQRAKTNYAVRQVFVHAHKHALTHTHTPSFPSRFNLLGQTLSELNGLELHVMSARSRFGQWPDAYDNVIRRRTGGWGAASDGNYTLQSREDNLRTDFSSRQTLPLHVRGSAAP
jgi:hypothetical protein